MNESDVTKVVKISANHHTFQSDTAKWKPKNGPPEAVWRSVCTSTSSTIRWTARTFSAGVSQMLEPSGKSGRIYIDKIATSIVIAPSMKNNHLITVDHQNPLVKHMKRMIIPPRWIAKFPFHYTKDCWSNERTERVAEKVATKKKSHPFR